MLNLHIVWILKHRRSILDGYQYELKNTEYVPEKDEGAVFYAIGSGGIGLRYVCMPEKDALFIEPELIDADPMECGAGLYRRES